MPGIYEIQIADRTYVGSTRQEMKYRWRTHRYELKAGSHANRYMQNLYNKYGPEALRFTVLEDMPHATAEEIRQREQDFLDERFHEKRNINMSPISTAPGGPAQAIELLAEGEWVRFRCGREADRAHGWSRCTANKMAAGTQSPGPYIEFGYQDIRFAENDDEFRAVRESYLASYRERSYNRETREFERQLAERKRWKVEVTRPDGAMMIAQSMREAVQFADRICSHEHIRKQLETQRTLTYKGYTFRDLR